MNKYKLLIVILFHSVINYVSAQINGRIVDAETGEAVAFATISFQHGKSGSISNSFGDFSINAVPSDTITLSHINYEPVVFLGQTLSSSPEVKMKKADYTIEEVVVSVKSLPQIAQKSIQDSKLALIQPLSAQGYYREFVYEDMQTTKFADGILTFHLNDWNDKAKKIQAHIEQARVKSKEQEDAFDIISPLDVRTVFSIARLDFLNAVIQNSESYSFEIKNYKGANQAEQLRIGFKPKEAAQQSLYSGYIIIDKESNLVQEATLQLEPSLIHYQEIKNAIVFKGQLCDKAITVKYQMGEEGYYPLYSSITLDMKIWNNKINKMLAFRSDCIIVNCHVGDDQLKGKNNYSQKALWKYGNSYNNEFWRYGNVMPLTDKEQTMIDNL
nr:carboxypeptidase-like regulatory domain-containing protein [uncultured Carboxylicivirga sp.]